MASTPAPTLEELPPQKGSILELHSINEDFDGKLVEFLKEDKEYMGGSDKIYVRFLDGNEQSLRVKKICCRRPDIKPLELRRLLHSLSEKIVDDIMEESGNCTEGDEARIKSFLEKDPCCAFAHEALGRIMVSGDETYRETKCLSSQQVVVVVKHFRRALGSMYACRDILVNPERYEQRLEMQISQFLTVAGHNKSAIRMHPRVLNPSDPSFIPTMHVTTEYFAGLAFKSKGDKLNGKFGQQHNKYMKAVSHFLRAVIIVGNIHDNGDTVDGNTLSCAAQSITNIHTIFQCFSHQESNTDGDGNTDLTMSMLKIADDLLEACTNKSGAVYVLNDDDDDDDDDDDAIDDAIKKAYWVEKSHCLRQKMTDTGVEE